MYKYQLMGIAGACQVPVYQEFRCIAVYHDKSYYITIM